MQLKPFNRSAFTLIELLVVIAIIALLAAILFPVFARVREKARATSCLSNMKQIGLGVQQYIQDYDSTFPIFYAYNSQPAAGLVGHKGIELELQPYTKSLQIFKCPDDAGGPFVATDGDCASNPSKQDSYHSCYGSSYRFTSAAYSIVDNESSQNNKLAGTPGSYLGASRLVTDSMFVRPSETRIMRDEMLPWFGPDQDPNGTKYRYYSADSASNYYRQWHSAGGTFLFADGHAKITVSPSQFDTMFVDPEATRNFATSDYDGD